MVFIYCIEDLNGLKYIYSKKRTGIEDYYNIDDNGQCSSRELDLQNSKIVFIRRMYRRKFQSSRTILDG